jgi:hypothetical protein
VPPLLSVQDALSALGQGALPPRGPVGLADAAAFAGSMATASSEAWTVMVARWGLAANGRSAVLVPPKEAVPFAPFR